MKIGKRTIYAAASSSFLTSYLIHHPTISNRIYSDILSFWFRHSSAFGLPYINFPFEYPPISGFLTYISMILGKQIEGYYLIFSIIIFIFYVILIESVRRMISGKNGADELIIIFLAVSPSMILYMIYNFDVIFISLVILSLLLLEAKKVRWSAITFGAAALTKLMSFILLPIIIPTIKGKREKITYIAISVGLFCLVNIALYALSPIIFPQTYLHHAEWGLEDSWLIYLFPDESSWNTAKLMSLILMAYALLKVYLSKIGDVYERCFMAFTAFLLTNYVFTPQMFLWLLPFLAIMRYIPWTYFIVEFANAGIILTWFSVPDPVKAYSLPQNLALLRAIALFIMLIQVYLSARRREK
ncbi:MAG TPA: DUF2029 domain-containing protein [Nitrososphaeria archaeon]|nr:DUF2029 domain-containing protein [Nitrososphaeria archaeon]